MPDDRQSSEPRYRAVVQLARDLWLRHGRTVIIAAVAALIVGVAVGPATLAVPATCNPCHSSTGEYTEWRDSAHASIGCQECHESRGYLFGVGNSVALGSETWQTVFGRRGDRAWVPNGACTDCHVGIGQEETFEVSGLRMSHRGIPEAGYACVECHADVAHTVNEGRLEQPTMSTCARCHDNRTASGACSLCHVDSSGTDSEKRRDAEFARTHGPSWEKTHGMGELSTCVLCHDEQKCRSCHGVALPHDAGFAATHGRDAIESRDPCLTGCHTSAFCDSCHGMEMPHPPTFLPEHSQIAHGVEDELCARCHTTANCYECHDKHIHPGGRHSMRSFRGE